MSWLLSAHAMSSSVAAPCSTWICPSRLPVLAWAAMALLRFSDVISEVASRISPNFSARPDVVTHHPRGHKKSPRPSGRHVSPSSRQLGREADDSIDLALCIAHYAARSDTQFEGPTDEPGAPRRQTRQRPEGRLNAGWWAGCPSRSPL